MTYERTIKFDYFTVCIAKENTGDLVRFDFESWISKANDEGIEKKEISFDNTIARLEDLEGDKKSKLWKLRFLKLRDTNIPSIVKRENEAKPIILDDDEYIGEDLLMIYDRENQVAMIQCNRFAMTKGKLEKFLNAVWDDQENRIVLVHISRPINMDQLRKKNYRFLALRLANIHAVEDKHRPFSDIVNGLHTMGSRAGAITFSLGRGRQPKKGLNQQEVPILLDDIYANQDIVSDAVLKVKDDDDTTDIDVVDLFNYSVVEYIKFKMEERTTLEFNYATRLMVEKYIARKKEINALLS